MDRTTADPAVVHSVVRFARDLLEIELEKLDMPEAIFLGSPLAPMSETRRANLDKPLDVEGLTTEEAVAKKLDLVLEYWTKTNQKLIERAIGLGRKDIAKMAGLKVAKVKAMVSRKLREDPGFVRDDDEEAAAAPGDQAHRENVETADAQPLPMETPTRAPRRNWGQRELQLLRADMQGKQVATGPPSPRKARSQAAQNNSDLQLQIKKGIQAQSRGALTGTGPRGRTARGRGAGRSPSRSPTKPNPGQQRDGEPAQTQIETPRRSHNDEQPDSIITWTDRSPVSDAPKSTAFRSDTRGRNNPAPRALLEPPTAPTKQGPRRNARRGVVSKIEQSAANADANATAKPRPARRAAPKSRSASNPPAPAPSPKCRETPHLLDKIDRQCDDLEQQLDSLRASIRSLKEASQQAERELQDLRRVADNMRRRLSTPDEFALLP